MPFVSQHAIWAKKNMQKVVILLLVVVGVVLATSPPYVPPPGPPVRPPIRPPVRPPCQVTFDIQPVCGTDGKTYNNVSELKCAARDRPGLEVKFPGRCDEPPKPPPVYPKPPTYN